MTDEELEKIYRDCGGDYLENEAVLGTIGYVTSELLNELKFARDQLEDWACYASDYFQQKNNLPGILAHIDSIIEKYEED